MMQESSERSSTYAVMMCGHTLPEVEARWGDYGDMAQQLLEDTARPEVWTKFNVCDGNFPTDEQLSHCQGIVITGSKHDAFSDEPWIVTLRALMKHEAHRGQRILGICFGCQLLAISLGGDAGRAYCGWESGSRPMTMLPAFFEQPFARDLPKQWQLNVHQTHKDQVLALPPESKLLAYSSKTRFEFWRWRSNVLAIQGHPEFTVPFQHALNQYRCDIGTMEPEERAEAEESMRQFPVTPENARELATLLQHFLKDSTP